MLALPARIAAALDAAAPAILPTLARLVLAATLLVYYLRAGLTKLSGPVTLDFGAYTQIWPRAFEASGYDPSAMSALQTLVAFAGAYAELILPVLIVAGLFTRLAALGLAGVIVIQSLTDIFGHGLGAADIGAWFDAVPTALIVDQRAYWLLALATLVLRGGGPLSLDRLLWRR